MTSRDIVVAGALARHQIKTYLNALGVEWVEIVLQATVASVDVNGEADYRVDRSSFRVVDATEVQWGQIQEWVKKVTQ